LLQQQSTAVTGAVAGMPGDYNQDNVVNAADYSIWRDAFGSTVPLPNDNTPGAGQDDFARWKSHFADTSDNMPLMANSVPECPTLVYGTIVLVAAMGRAWAGAPHAQRFVRRAR